MAVPVKGENGVKGIESAILDNNQELINSLIMQKLREEFKGADVPINMLQGPQLMLKIRMIASAVIAKFKALHGFESGMFVQNQVDLTMKKIKKMESNGMFDDSREYDEIVVGKSGIEYQIIEAELLKNYNQAEEEVQTLVSRLTQLNTDTFNLKKDINGCLDQVTNIYIISI